MPNWCATNWKIRGKAKDVQAFCDIVNDLPNRPDVEENGFGKYWLKNFAVALGVDPETCDNLRGTVDTDSGLCASLVFPESDNEKLEVNNIENGQAEASFSTASAWGMPVWLENYLADKFEYGYSTTDEFGNFHCVHNTDFFPWIYELHTDDEWEEYRVGEEEKVIKDLEKALNKKLDIPAAHEGLLKFLNENMADLWEDEIEFIVYEIE